MSATPFASASLYVGDLAPDVNEAILYDIFNSVGPVSYIRVNRDAVTRRSLGYAYVNFHSVMDAERALNTLNYTPIRSKPCRIMWSHRDPTIRKSGSANIFIKNLDKTIDHKALYDTFSIFGNILSCKVSLDEQGQSRGYGFVHYENDDSAREAIANVNGMQIGSRIVWVGPFVRKAERNVPGDAKFTNVFVKNLPEYVTDDKLRDLFTRFGTISSAVIMIENGKSKGFGFVNFEKVEDARQAVEEMNEHQMDGKTLYVGRAQKKSEREAELRSKFEAMKAERQQKYQNVNLYVKHLDESVDDDKLRELFLKFGSITSAKVMRDDKGISKGFGFVCLSSPEEASRASQEMNGALVNGKPLYVALHLRKEVRRAQLEAQYNQRGMNAFRMVPGMPPQPMYAQPMFYQGMPQARPGFMYPQQVMRGPYRAGPPQPGMRPPFPMAVNYAAQQGPAGGPQRQGQARTRVGGRNVNGQPGKTAGAGGRGGKGNFKYNANARNNRPESEENAAAATTATPGEATAAPVPAASEPLTATALANAPPEIQKQMLGERLFPLIGTLQPAQAPKITGMLLEMDNAELLMLLESQEALSAKVNEAMEVLREHGLVETA